MKKLILLLIGVALWGASLKIKRGWQLLGATRDINVSFFNHPDIEAIWSYKDKEWFCYFPHQEVFEKGVLLM